MEDSGVELLSESSSLEVLSAVVGSSRVAHCNLVLPKGDEARTVVVTVAGTAVGYRSLAGAPYKEPNVLLCEYCICV